jgi:predicted amidohydrolase YtcJ
MELLIKNGTVVTESESFIADVAVKDGRIALIGTNLAVEATTVVDASGKYVLPGAIDAHLIWLCHSAEPYRPMGTYRVHGLLPAAVSQPSLTIPCSEGQGHFGNR